MARKKPNVAALLSMYWDNVGRAPRGPAPPLRERHENGEADGLGEVSNDELDAPQNTIRAEDETDREPYTRTHHCTHSIQGSEGMFFEVEKTRERHTNLTTFRVLS